ncbi:deoxyribodipyrimidine photo-lyase [Anabaena sp. UHCC 0204]|uniref:deoxyribodipyrimidine photo-lyase n=1 Tax=Anabaena sp. UHCC 0204 TaxID=2590009 RepID=UPI0014455E43|nr:deoxyribodipyrimidine photo-lyase [Anabaena sp. UHCC 0204]MTJ06490.1 deoxyribodipyrimidine photo-lyase [Anabaena sp. UHCC 0204]
MNNPVIWINGDCLSPHNPALQEYPQAPALWVWDDVLISEWQIGIKRLTFIYECLLELPVEIRRGNIAAEILNFTKEHNANLVVTTDSPSPRFNDICNQIHNSIKLEILSVEPFFEYDGYIDLQRFSRYWKVAKKYVFE